MTSTHAERLARLNVLNLRRTQGNWKAHRYNPSNIGYSDKGIWGVHSDLRGARRSKIKGTAVACGIAINAEATARFIEAAPEAVSLCNDLAAENSRLKELLGEAAKALAPFNDAFVEANKWTLPGVKYCEHTAQAVLTGCINSVTLDDFKNAAIACKAAGIGGK